MMMMMMMIDAEAGDWSRRSSTHASTMGNLYTAHSPNMPRVPKDPTWRRGRVPKVSHPPQPHSNLKIARFLYPEEYAVFNTRNGPGATLPEGGMLSP